MLSYDGYIGLWMFIYFSLLILFYTILALIRNGLFAKILKVTLSIDAKLTPDRHILIKLGRTYMKIENRVYRLIWVFLLGFIYSVISMIFLDQCVFTTYVLGVNQLCFPDTPNCYIFNSRWTLSTNVSFVCIHNEPVIPANSSGVLALCWGYILPDQTAVSIINQLGISTSLVGLFAFVFWIFSHMARSLLGVIILGISNFIIFTAIILLSFAKPPYGLVTSLIITSITFLNVITIFIIRGPYSGLIPQYRIHPFQGQNHGQYRRRRHPFYGSPIRKDLFHLSKY